MKKFLIGFIVLAYTLMSIYPTIAASNTRSSSESQTLAYADLVYPQGDDFAKLKSIIDRTFSPADTTQRYGYNCIMNGQMCPNYRYTSIDEKAIKLIVLKTYTGNEDFYKKLLPQRNTSSWMFDSEQSEAPSGVKQIIGSIPKGTKLPDWKNLGFGRSSVSSDLLEASFGIGFESLPNSASMLGAIENTIRTLKQQNCREEGGAGCYSTDLSNRYLPTPEELYAEQVFLNGQRVKIENLKDEFEYIVEYTESQNQPKDLPVLDIYSILNLIPRESLNYMNIYQKGLQVNSVLTVIEKQEMAAELYDLIQIEALMLPEAKVTVHGIIQDFLNRISISSQAQSIPESYTLRYKKTSYTLEEAKKVIEEKETSVGDNIVYTSEGIFQRLPCQNSGGYLARSECAAATSDMRNVTTALGAYFADRENYPDAVDKLDRMYLPNPDTLQRFQKNFEYRRVQDPTLPYPSFEIRYIGTIGASDTSGVTTSKPDYTALLSGASVPAMPQIFSYVPSDSMMLYVKNPSNLLELLTQDSPSAYKDTVFDTQKSIQGFITSYFGITDIREIADNLTHEIVIIVDNLDATAPEIVMVLSEADKGALSPTATSQIVSTKDGYIFVASSQEFLDRVSGLSEQNSIKNAPDFQYVWYKKADYVKDAFMYVGDAFFEKMITFENYILHARKYNDYSRLTSLQELLWAYSDAFSGSINNFSELQNLGFFDSNSGALKNYTIENGIVRHSNIGTMTSVNTISESRYDLSEVSREEVDAYKYNILKYREVWTNALDPMGIVLNRYGDGIDVDFFMTPIPQFADADMNEIFALFAGTTKDSLSIVSEESVRMGLLSLVFGFDSAKLQEKLAQNKELSSGFSEFNEEVLDGKNILDYIGGEFAWTLGGLDPDILDGWNIEKIDTYITVEFTSEEKGKELVELIRTKMLEEVGDSRGSEAELIRGFLAKPFIEDYAGKKIYYIEGLPIPFVGKIGVAYTFIDTFFYIGLNRPTIRKIIDTSLNGDARKSDIVSKDSIDAHSFFAVLFDGISTSDALEALYENNKTAFPKYMRYIDMGSSESSSVVKGLLATYYASEYKNKKLGKNIAPISRNFGSLVFSGEMDNIHVRIEEEKLSSLSGEVLQMWNNLKEDSGFASGMLASEGLSIDAFLEQDNLDLLMALNLIITADSVFASDTSFLQNHTFSMSLGDNEIGFRFRAFRESESELSLKEKFFTTIPKNILLIVGIALMLGLIGGVGYAFSRRKNQASTIETASPIVPVSPLPQYTPVPTTTTAIPPSQTEIPTVTGITNNP